MKAQVELQVSGMHCDGCAQRAVSAVRRADGVLEVSADHYAGWVQVTYDPERADPAVFVERLAAAGFEPLRAGERR